MSTEIDWIPAPMPLNQVNHSDSARGFGAAPALVSRGAAGRTLRFAMQTQERLAAGIAMIAGFVDAYGIITYGTYLSFMSGNTTQTGYRIGQGNFAEAVPSALAIGFFFIGSFAGAILADSVRRQAQRLVFGVVAASLALIVCFTQFGLLYGSVHIAAISFAMGIMNTALSRLGAMAVSLTFVTGTLTKLGLHLALAVRRAPVPDSQGPWDTHMHRALLLLSIWGAFLIGAFLSGVMTPRFGAWVLLFPALILSLSVFDRSGVRKCFVSFVSLASARKTRARCGQ
jgi:uncharacterized membrane protein YoaK (UPF0700 family)